MNIRVIALACLAIVGCSKKNNTESTSAPAAESASTVASAPSPVASPVETEVANAPPDIVKASSTAQEPVEPNAPPSHAEHTRAAAAEIHKGNYKSELERLEKETDNP